MKSEKINRISPSVTIEITTIAKELKRQGKDVVLLAAGEPDFPSPDHVKAGAIKAIENNFTTYTETAGIPELKEAICKKFFRDNGLSYKPEEIMVNCGSKHAIYLALQCLLSHGDKVLMSLPCWNSYIEQVKLAEGEPLLINSREDMSLDIDKLKDFVTDEVKILLLNSPCNPTGHVFTEKELKAIGEIALTHKDLFILSDEVYEYFIYEGKHVSLTKIFPELKNRTVIVNSVSKSYSMPGWRIGYAAGPKELISAMTALQGHITSNPSSISQIAAMKAIDGDQSCVKHMFHEFSRRRDFVIDKLNKLPMITCSPPKGAFYAFIDISKTGMDSRSFARKLLEEELVALVPGIAFGYDNFVRLSFASAYKELERGMERIERFMCKIND
ncbi:MAG: pyridoxal phosphate-dependent aminotransferase [Candidatus Eremiobacterota bacterium]